MSVTRSPCRSTTAATETASLHAWTCLAPGHVVSGCSVGRPSVSSHSRTSLSLTPLCTDRSATPIRCCTISRITLLVMHSSSLVVCIVVENSHFTNFKNFLNKKNREFLRILKDGTNDVFFTLLSFDTSKYRVFLQGANWNFSDLFIIIQELIHVGYQQTTE